MHTDFRAKIVLDSIAPCGVRLTTMEWTYPRFIHSEFMTHRDRERNAASSRAIPWPKMMTAITEKPVIPIFWGKEQKGMQTGEEIDCPGAAEIVWLNARDQAVCSAQALANLGVHKSLCNRLTEPFMWITVVVTATEWKNLFRQRIHPDAEIHFQRIAQMAKNALDNSVPTQLAHNQRHLPYVVEEDFKEGYPLNVLTHFSVARVSRVSYTNQNGKRDPLSDIRQYGRLVTGSGFGHWSPFGHVADATNNKNYRSGPFRGWKQFRKDFPNENIEG